MINYHITPPTVNQPQQRNIKTLSVPSDLEKTTVFPRLDVQDLPTYQRTQVFDEWIQSLVMSCVRAGVEFTDYMQECFVQGEARYSCRQKDKKRPDGHAVRVESTDVDFIEKDRFFSKVWSMAVPEKVKGAAGAGGGCGGG